MRKISVAVMVICLMISLTACAMKQKKVEKEMQQPINCATAEGDKVKKPMWHSKLLRV